MVLACIAMMATVVRLAWIRVCKKHLSKTCSVILVKSDDGLQADLIFPKEFAKRMAELSKHDPLES